MIPSPDPSTRPAPPVVRARTLCLIGTSIGLLMFVRDWLDQLAAGEQPRIWVTLVEELTGAWLAVLLVPLVVRLVRHCRPPARHRWLYLPLHAGGALAFGAAHTTLMWVSRSLLMPVFGLGDYDYGQIGIRYLMELPLQVAVYAATAVLTLAFDRYRGLRDAEVEATALRGQLAHAQLEALARQIEPHFLFNTLNAISELMYAAPRRADEMLSRLSELLRQAFRQRSEPETTLAEELRLLELYLSVMRLRLADRMTVTLDVPEPLQHAAVPRFLLQPLVENALEHGIDPATQTVRVEISAFAETGRLLIRVRDHGRGPTHTVEPGVGLGNTVARIERLYGRGYGIVLQAAEGGGAEALVRLPLSADIGPTP